MPLGATLTVVWASGCANDAQNSKKKQLSEGSGGRDALYSDGDVAEESDNPFLSTTGSNSTKTPAASKPPSWSLPGAPRTAPRIATNAQDLASDQASAGGKSTDSSTPTKSATEDGDKRWGVILLTFSGEDHKELADAACLQLRRRYSILADAFVREKSNGSIVLIGKFSGPDDPAAKPLVKSVQALTDGDQRPFARSFLTRVDAARQGPMGAFDLRRARLENPGVRTIYSVEVAVWSDFGSNEISLEQIRSKAEGYAKQLRAQGLPAFYNHDDDRRMSIVTIGLFGADAYDAKSTLYSDEVQAIKDRFPKLMVNGEELLKPIRKGSQETVAEKSLLVEVPH